MSEFVPSACVNVIDPVVVPPLGHVSVPLGAAIVCFIILMFVVLPDDV
jgi:hypothetical protein